MTLTEKWKKGELEEFYGKPFYIKKQSGVVKVDYLCKYGFVNNYDVVEVLAPCDYEELEQLKIDNYSLNAWIKNFQPKYKKMEKENQQLKELLKECLDEIHELAEIQDNRSVTIYNFLSAELITKIDNAIGEKK